MELMLALLPAAGRGTRMATITRGEPKELLPLAGARVIDLLATECADYETVLVWSEAKGAPPLSNARVVDQPRPLGLGDALARAIGDASEALVALPDVVFAPASPLPRLADALAAGADFALAVEEVSELAKGSYGVAELSGGEDFRIERLIEKPRPGETVSRWAVASRYALGPAVLDRLRAHPRGEEFDLTSILQAVLEDGGIGPAIPLAENERRYDCGLPAGYAAAVEALGR